MTSSILQAGDWLLITKQKRWIRLAYDDTVIFLVFVADILIWRGFWNLSIIYFITDPLIGGWTDHVTGALLMLLFQVFSYAGVCGYYKDSRKPELQKSRDTAAIFNTDYLRHFFPKEQPNGVSEFSDSRPIYI